MNITTWLAPLLIVIDQVIKVLIFEAVGRAAGQRVFDTDFQSLYLQKLFWIFDLTFVKNAGAAYGMFQGGARILVIASLAVGMGILVYFSKPKPIPMLGQVAWSLVAAGALGNAIDRLGRGWVIDFMDTSRTGIALLDDFPVWNFADACVVVGVVLLLVEGFLPKRAVQTPPTDAV